MWEAVRDRIEEIPFGWGVFALGVAAIVFQIVLLALAGWRRRRGRAPLPLTLHAIAGASIAALLFLGSIEVEGGRAQMVSVFAGLNPDPSMRATLLGRGLETQVFVIPLVGQATVLALPLWIAGLWTTLRTPRPDGRVRSFPPALLVAAGLLPVAFGMLSWNGRVDRSLSAIAGVDPSMKRKVLEPALAEARAQFAGAARTSTIAILILAVVAIAWIVARSGRGSAATSPAPRSALTLVLSAAALALAALLVVAARPAKAENELPWPPPTSAVMTGGLRQPTPDLVGPDAPEDAPDLEISSDGFRLNGQAMDLEEIERDLARSRRNFSEFNPGRAFDGTILIKADPATPTAPLDPVLWGIAAVGYRSPMFVFITKKTHVRPAFGQMEMTVVTGARVEVVPANDADREAGGWKSVFLRLDDFADYGAFARQLVASRTAGKTVLVKLEDQSFRPARLAPARHR